MSDIPARLLKLLSLLQSPRQWPGSELADRLQVSPRTIRRDIERLRELGYPVEAARGSISGYRLVAGTAMPPLLLDDEEAVAIGLRAAAGNAVKGIEDASVRALMKLERVLPARLRWRVRSLNAATVQLAGYAHTIDPVSLAVLATAIANHEHLRFGYRAANGEKSTRNVEPHNLVATGRCWYLVAYDTNREDWRIFRVDRIHETRPTGSRFVPRELPAADAGAYVTSQLYNLAPIYQAVVTLHATVEEIANRLGEASEELEPINAQTCRLHSHVDTLEWLAFRLVTLGCEFEMHDPPELATYLHELGARHACRGILNFGRIKAIRTTPNVTQTRKNEPFSPVGEASIAPNQRGDDLTDYEQVEADRSGSQDPITSSAMITRSSGRRPMESVCPISW